MQSLFHSALAWYLFYCHLGIRRMECKLAPHIAFNIQTREDQKLALSLEVCAVHCPRRSPYAQMALRKPPRPQAHYRSERRLRAGTSLWRSSLRRGPMLSCPLSSCRRSSMRPNKLNPDTRTPDEKCLPYNVTGVCQSTFQERALP